MEYKVDIHIQHLDDQSVIAPLGDFFSSVAETTILNEEEHHVKESYEAIGIVLSIVGAWAAERYLLDPLANKVNEWMQAIRDVWAQSGSKRPVHIVITFDDDTNTMSIEFLKTTDLRSLEKVWSDIEQVLQVRARAEALGIQLQKVRVLWDGSDDFLAVGYEAGRPAYLIDLQKAQLQPLQRKPSSIDDVDAATEVWLLEKIIEHSNYLQAISQRGYEVPSDELRGTQKEIVQRKRKLRA